MSKSPEVENPAEEVTKELAGAVKAPSVGQAAVSGVFWLGMGQVIKQVIAISAAIFLARLLAPGDFGVFSMVVFAMELAQVLTDFGFGSAIIQRRISESIVLSTCFWLNVGIALAAGILLAASGPLLANFFNQPILIGLALACGVNVVLSCTMNVPQALLTQRFDFRKQMQAQIVGSIVGAISAVVAAFSGAGVWSLIIQPLAGSTVTLILMFRAVHWLPRFEFDFSRVRDIVNFGKHLLGDSIVQALGRNLHNLILGKSLGAAPLGIYNMAQSVSYAPIYQISVVVIKVLFPALVNLNDEPERQGAAYKRVVAAIALVSFPCMAGLFAVTDDFVLVVFGAKWEEMAPVLKVICWVVMIQSVATTASTVLLSKGQSKTMFRLSTLFMFTTAIGLLVGSQWGLLGTAFGWGAAATLHYMLLTWTATRTIGLRWLSFVQALASPFLAALGMALILIFMSSLLTSYLPQWRLAVMIVLGILIYLVLTFIVNKQEALGLLKLLRATWFGRRRGSR